MHATEYYLGTPRSNVGMSVTPNSMVAQGDFPTELATIPVRPHELPVPYMPEGDLVEGISLAGTLYPKQNYDFY